MKKPTKDHKIIIPIFLKEVVARLKEAGAQGKYIMLTVESTVIEEPFQMNVAWAQDGHFYYTRSVFREESRRLSLFTNYEAKILRKLTRLYVMEKLDFYLTIKSSR